ncbi:alpha/beta fold hydrolase [Kitasatospora sp. SUK 42]|uniref:alpha/beta fold hydrolase n=1 Tax=Kitasatospora sp. SUK 42 TaxID=1588882 RepID=UPI001C3163A0|nr:alpha/beta hydrolase [Kitasatospora sp. SUK 42]MBV2153037.1 alpha/beta hydrolase [Kitasatospora sp. SUK 42]
MVNFVLVAGARLGAWAWDDVAPRLRAAGHGVHPLTLSGLAEKRGTPAGQQTHVRDIVAEVERLDLREVVLVGHSYAGVPAGQAAGRIGERLARIVLVDAAVPVDGESFAQGWPDGGRELVGELAANGGHWPRATAAHFAGHDLTDEQIARIVAGSTPHPGATLTEPAALTRPLGELPGTYVLCLPAGEEPSAQDLAELPAGEHWRLVELRTGHWPMFSRPGELARILLDAAGAGEIGAS